MFKRININDQLKYYSFCYKIVFKNRKKEQKEIFFLQVTAFFLLRSHFSTVTLGYHDTYKLIIYIYIYI